MKTLERCVSQKTVGLIDNWHCLLPRATIDHDAWNMVDIQRDFVDENIQN